MLKFIHAADFHLDSAFGALTAQQAGLRRRELREIPARLANYVNQSGVDAVFLTGDLFDSNSAYRETGEQLLQALGQMSAQVLIAPGNHDWYGPGSPYAALPWPDNVHIFSTREVSAFPLGDSGVTVWGNAYTAPQQPLSPLRGFSAPDGGIHIGLFHGEMDAPQSSYQSITREEAAQSGLAYLALGHIHKRTQPFFCGRTLCAWPGCPEGRGFDELGEKGFYEGTLSPEGTVQLTFVPFARRQYQRLTVDVTGKDPLQAVEAALPPDTTPHLYRILLTGETGEAGISLPALQEALSPRFFSLELQDHTRMAEDVWSRCREDSLRGEFLRELRRRWDAAQETAEKDIITQAARFGLAALDHRDLGGSL